MSKQAFLFLILSLLIKGANILKAEPTVQQLTNKNDALIVPLQFIKEKAFVRRAKGMNGLGLFSGHASIGPIAGLEWSYQFLLSSQFKILGGVEWKNETYVAYRSIFLQPMLFHTAFTNYNNFCVNVGGGLIFTHIKKYDEKVDRDDKDKSDDKSYGKKLDKGKSNLNVGLILGGEAELFIVKTLEITLAGGPIIYLFKDDYDRIAYYLSLGLKFNF